MIQLFENPNFDFLRWRYLLVGLSLVLMAVGAIAFLTNGINLGIDFAGGANVVIRFQEKPPIDELRRIVQDATIQRYGRTEENALLIRLPKQGLEGDYAGQLVARLHEQLNPDQSGKLDLNFQGSEAIGELLASADPAQRGSGAEADAYYHDLADQIIAHRSELELFHEFREVAEVPGVNTAVLGLLQEQTYLGAFNVLGQESVGPQVGRELQKKAFWALVLSTLAMGIYIVIRFDLKFGVAAILCLVHDVLLVLSFLLVTGIEFSILAVAAFLTLIGYSINDTVVIYDRVRENIKRLRVKMDFADVLNLSMNQTLSRTILTSGSTLLVLICLIIWGGEVINGFAWLLLVGVIVGTYSTLTVVPTIVLLWNRYLAREKSIYGGGSTRRVESSSGASTR